MIKYYRSKGFFASSFFDGNKVLMGFTDKNIGDGRDLSTVINFFDRNRIFYQKIILAKQTHSKNVFFVGRHFQTPEKISLIDGVDGLLTNLPQVILGIRTADCLPIIYWEREKNIIAISHNGWRGTLRRLSWEIIDSIEYHGGKLNKLLVALGPGIGRCCYKISEDLYYKFSDEWGFIAKNILFRKQQELYLDLYLANILLLKQRGVNEKNIDFFPFCTKCDKKRFYSFRRKSDPSWGNQQLSFIIRYE